MRVTRLSTTPVKGLALHHPTSIRIDDTGAVGDRLFYLADARPSLVSIAKTGALVGISAEYDALAHTLTLRDDSTVLAHDEVREELHLGADARQAVERGHRGLDFVAHAPDVDQQLRRVPGRELAAQETDHAPLPGEPMAARISRE